MGMYPSEHGIGEGIDILQDGSVLFEVRVIAVGGPSRSRNAEVEVRGNGALESFFLEHEEEIEILPGKIYIGISDKKARKGNVRLYYEVPNEYKIRRVKSERVAPSPSLV